MKTCLVVDDSEVVRKVALRIFETLNLEAAEAESGQGALDLCAKNMPDGILLDSYMPPMATVEFLASLRALANGSKPVVVYCATENDSTEIARALTAGADDYVLKPFDLHELAARLRALVRRSAGEAAALLRVGEVELDPAARRAQFKGRSVELPAREFALLHALMLGAGRVLTREQLAERLYAWGEEIESNAIDVHIHHLRRKLAPALIRTVRGVGYVLPRPQNG